MKIRSVVFALSAIATIFSSALLPAQTPPVPDPVAREFRSTWIATVGRIDWPPSSDTAESKTALIGYMDMAVEMNMNAVIFQVRTSCEALYKSDLEPWSQYLTGTQGQAPDPYWDPLEFAIEAAHDRGLELHAWFNPYRVSYTSTTTGFAPSHIANRRPDLIRQYGNYVWLDPGEPEVPEYSLSVVMDVVNRYDVDGIHFDDYFYPYNTGGEFPDDASYQKYQTGGGALGRADWRRDNVNRFVESVYDSIKEAKPQVKFGISPFGIWRPGNPAGIQGLDSYASIYADSKKWLNEGWVDYLVPQLYWGIDPRQQSFPALLDWWISESTHNRPIFAGLALYKLSSKYEPDEISRQILETQSRPLSLGSVGFSAKDYRRNLKGVKADVIANAYQEKTLVPEMSWLDDVKPESPAVAIDSSAGLTISWTPSGSEAAFRWVVYWYRNGAWEHEILNRAARSFAIPNGVASAPTHIAVTAVDRMGNESALQVKPVAVPTVWGVQ